MTLDGLDSCSDEFPLQVAECIELLIAKQANNYIHQEVKNILKKLIDANNDEVNIVCTRTIEQLAMCGCD